MLQIRCSNDVETEVPGIILVIPPPDKKAFNEAQRYVTKARFPLFGQYMRFLYSYFMPICSIVKIITPPSIYRVIVYFLLCHESLNYSIGQYKRLYHGLVTRFPVKNTHALIDMRDNDARTVRL